MFSMKCKCVKYFANIILYIMFKFQILKLNFKKFITINYYYDIIKKIGRKFYISEIY